MRNYRPFMAIPAIVTPISMAALMPAAAQAYDPIVLSRGWERAAFTENDGCQAEVGTNGKFYVIAVYGLAPQERGQFYLTNEDIKPIVAPATANSEGVWSNYYIPFLWHHEGGTVNIEFSSTNCDLNLSFEWQRQGVKVHG